MSTVNAAINRRVSESLRRFMEKIVCKQKEAMHTDVVEFWTTQAPQLAEPMKRVWIDYCRVLDKRLATMEVSEAALREACDQEKAMAKRIAKLLHEHGIKSGQILEQACSMADMRLRKGLEALRRLNGRLDRIRAKAT